MHFSLIMSTSSSKSTVDYNDIINVLHPTIDNINENIDDGATKLCIVMITSDHDSKIDDEPLSEDEDYDADDEYDSNDEEDDEDGSCKGSNKTLTKRS